MHKCKEKRKISQVRPEERQQLLLNNAGTRLRSFSTKKVINAENIMESIKRNNCPENSRAEKICWKDKIGNLQTDKIEGSCSHQNQLN